MDQTMDQTNVLLKKQNRLNRLIVLMLAFAAWYLITSLTPEPARFATVTADTIGSRYAGDCLIVRDEAPFDAEGLSSVEYIAEEGSLVYRGTTICNVYSSGFSTREMTAQPTVGIGAPAA